MAAAGQPDPYLRAAGGQQVNDLFFYKKVIPVWDMARGRDGLQLVDTYICSLLLEDHLGDHP
jgi:hypothetical protein